VTSLRRSQIPVPFSPRGRAAAFHSGAPCSRRLQAARRRVGLEGEQAEIARQRLANTVNSRCWHRHPRTIAVAYRDPVPEVCPETKISCRCSPSRSCSGAPPACRRAGHGAFCSPTGLSRRRGTTYRPIACAGSSSLSRTRRPGRAGGSRSIPSIHRARSGSRAA